MKAVITIFLHVIASTFQLQCSYATYFIKIWVVPSFDSCSVCLTTNMNFDYWFYVISRQLTTFNDSDTNLKKNIIQIFVLIHSLYYLSSWWQQFLTPKRLANTWSCWQLWTDRHFKLNYDSNYNFTWILQDKLGIIISVKNFSFAFTTYF